MDAVLNRQDVTLPGEIAAWLYRPEGAEACVVMAHGLSAVRDMRLPAYAERFAAAGLAVLLFDYRGFGASGGEPRQVADIGAQLDDWRTAIAYAREFKRVGLFGSSFAGGHVLELAAKEDGHRRRRRAVPDDRRAAGRADDAQADDGQAQPRGAAGSSPRARRPEADADQGRRASGRARGHELTGHGAGLRVDHAAGLACG